MNPRIQELAEQARQEFLKLPTGYKPEQVGMHPQLMEKFAQLIVRECAGVCDLYAMPDGTSETAMVLSAAIKRKFGVEE